KQNWLGECSNKKFILLSNTHLDNNVDAFYEFSLEIVVDDFRTTFQRSVAKENMIYIESNIDQNKKIQMTKIFGEPKNIPELENEKYGSGKMYFYYIVPKSKIDKIIGIKRYRDTSTFGQVDGEQFTGEEEEMVLDLHNFDENTYRIFKEH